MEWHRPEMQPVSEDILQGSITSLIGLLDWLRDGKTIYIPDTAQNPGEIEVDLSSLQMRDVQSLVLAPITVDGRVQAVLGCSNLLAPAEVVQTNLRALELVAGMLKSLFQREQLIETLEKQIAERTRQLTTFLDMAMFSDHTQNLTDILQPTLLSISQIVDCDALSIHIFNEKQSRLEVRAHRGIPLETLKLLSEIEIDAELAAWLEEMDPYQTSDNLEREPAFPEPFCLPGYASYYSNSLRAGNKLLGILNCYRIEDQPFSPFQGMLLVALGDLLGIIVENYHLRIEGQELATVEERQRLAREIHDAVSQAVYSLSLFARSAKDALEEGDSDELSVNLEDIEATALRVMHEMRLLLYQLQETRQDQNIEITLDNRFRNVENRLGIKTTREIETDIFLPSHIHHEVWRIINEALNNAIKHASAARVHVQISCNDENLRVSIQDDGVGFDPRDYSPGMGLKNMQRRAEALDGSLEITSKLRKGTQILLKIPMTCLEPGEGE